jgi:pimeloyl-ACP methyl ester carboxylesterase
VRAPGLSGPPSAGIARGRHERARAAPAGGVRRGLLGLAALLVALALGGAAGQVVAAERDRRAHPPPGQLVDVGGHRLHLRVLGEPAGGPTVVLEAGGGLPSPIWAWVQQAVAPAARVVAYDRAGTGWSDPGPAPRDASHVATELHTALRRAGVPGPYVLVGYSFGGLYVRVFADRYPDEVVGMVLVDPSHPDQTRRSPAQRRAVPTTARLAQGLDVLRVADVTPAFFPGLPPAQHAELRTFVAGGLWAGAGREFAALETLTFPQVRATRGLGARPLAVLSAAEHDDPVMPTLQAELATLSSDSTHEAVAGAGHTSIVFQRGPAHEVAAHILRVVAAARTGQPLARAAGP